MAGASRPFFESAGSRLASGLAAFSAFAPGPVPNWLAALCWLLPLTGGVKKAASKTTGDGLPAHSFATLLANLGTLTRNEAAMSASPEHIITVLAQPTPLQEKAFRLLEIDPAK